MPSTNFAWTVFQYFVPNYIWYSNISIMALAPFFACCAISNLEKLRVNKASVGDSYKGSSASKMIDHSWLLFYPPCSFSHRSHTTSSDLVPSNRH